MRETTYLRSNGSKYIRTCVWFEYGLEEPLHEFIATLETVLLSIPLEFRSKAIFEQTGGEGFGDGDYSPGHMKVYYDRDTSDAS